MGLPLLLRLSLRAKLIGMVAVVLGPSAGLTLMVYVGHSVARSTQALERELSSVADAVSRVLVPALEDDRTSGVRESLAALEALPGFQYAGIFDDSGRLRASNHAERLPKLAIASLSPGLSHGDGGLRLIRRLQGRAGPAGLLLVGLSRAPLERDNLDELSHALSFAAMLMVLGLLVAFGMGTYVVRPVRRLVDVARRISEGDLSAAHSGLGGREAVAHLATEPLGKDELHQLAVAFARMMSMLGALSDTLTGATGRLSRSVDELRHSAAEQSATLQEHARVLVQTQAIASNVQRNSSSATQQAEVVMRVAEEGERVSRLGEATLEQSLKNLAEIHEEVTGIAGEIITLRDEARRVGAITGAVKDLADQSYILALNGAMEAARSGEHGSGFTVVARDMRTLSDASIQRTKEIQRILADIVKAIQHAVATTEGGARKVEGSVDEVRASGTTVRELAALLGEIAGAVRGVVSSIAEQDAGINHVLLDIERLTQAMQETLSMLEHTNAAVEGVLGVASQMREVAQKLVV